MSANGLMTEVKELWQTPEPPELGPRERAGVMSARELSGRLDELFERHGRHGTEAELIRALTLLWHDHLDGSHTISQSIETADGSYVHGIMHRREPDYGNAKYWFRRVGRHRIFDALAEKAPEVLEENGAGEWEKRLVPGGSWDPFAFVDACQRAATDEKLGRVMRLVQAVEFRRLLEAFCGGATNG